MVGVGIEIGDDMSVEIGYNTMEKELRDVSCKTFSPLAKTCHV